MIHETAVIDKGAIIGDNVYIWHFSHVMKGAVVGNDCSLGQNVVVHTGASLGRGCRVQNNVSVYTAVHCAEDVFLGPSCVFTNVINPRAFIPRKEEYKETLVQRGVSIGANATIVCGITIGEYAMIGAGAVVTKDVKPFALIYGNPARQVAWVSRSGHKLSFDETGKAFCPDTGERYCLNEERGEVSLLVR